jgi:hypothetical protein
MTVVNARPKSTEVDDRVLRALLETIGNARHSRCLNPA